MNLVQKAVSRGGKLAPIVLKDGYYKGIGFMNPSVFVDDDGDILVNLRHVNYTLYHAENTQKFPTVWGPLAYLHPESDQNLRTINYLCRLDENLSLINSTQVDTSKLDVPPKWEFVGLEDARLVRWNGDLYQVGVRRDTTPHGEGRMEYSKLQLDKKKWTAKEVERVRIPTPQDPDSYCEKNWVPVLDKPYHFVKWTAPTELVYADPRAGTCEQVFHKEGLVAPADQRGSSQVVRWGNYYISITHEVSLFKNYLNQKDGIYRHRLCVFDDQMTLIGLSTAPFAFLDARIEFCAGADRYQNDLLVTFGFQDNAAFILRVTKDLVDEMIGDALTYVLKN